MKKIFKKEFTIGICVIATLAVLIFGIDYLKGINLFKPANFYIVSYDNVAGLDLSAPVTIDGYKVGQVREINFNYQTPGKIDVVLALNKELQLPEGSVATIASTLMSGAYIDLKLGNSKKMIPVGGRVESGNAPDLMSSIQDDIMPSINTILPRIDSLLCNLNYIITDPAIAQSIKRFDGITEYLLLSSAGLNNTLNSDIPLIMRNAKSITYSVDSIATNLNTLSLQLKTLPIQPTMANLETVSQNLAIFSENLNSEKGTAGLLMKDPELYYRLNRVSADIDSLLIDIKKNPKRYINIKLL